jgi:hypothetical protein
VIASHIGENESLNHNGISRFERRGSSADADKWQRVSGFQKGLIPPPQTPSPAIHKTEN